MSETRHRSYVAATRLTLDEADALAALAAARGLSMAAVIREAITPLIEEGEKVQRDYFARSAS